MFQFVKNFFAKHKLDIQNIGFVFTDDALAMLGNKPGFSALIKQEIPHLQGTVSFIVMPWHQNLALEVEETP